MNKYQAAVGGEEVTSSCIWIFFTRDRKEEIEREKEREMRGDKR